MNYLTLILVAIVGVIIGSYFGVRKKEGLIFGQAKETKDGK